MCMIVRVLQWINKFLNWRNNADTFSDTFYCLAEQSIIWKFEQGFTHLIVD